MAFAPSVTHGSELEKLTKLLGSPPAMPTCTAESMIKARPGYSAIDASEYLDSSEVLDAKVKLIADKLRAAVSAVVYTGAGISTAAGVDDYGSKASDSTGRVGPAQLASSPFMAEPTAAHRATVALHHAGHLKRWFQQNHDGLPQKAGLPQAAINEIHGSWYDPSNPVVNMAGQLREDLFADLLAWEAKADVCLALGTSMAGMNADRLCASVAERAGGLVIVNLQRTSLDELAAVRVFATLDVVMEKLAAELNCVVPGPAERVEYDEDAAVFTIATADGGTTELDLRPDAQIQLHGGRFDGAIGEVAGCDRQGNFNLRVLVSVSSKTGFKAVTPLKLGRWWTNCNAAATSGSGPLTLPVTNIACSSTGQAVH